MKKQMKKLALNRETLRSLEEVALMGAAGGSIEFSEYSCWNSCSTPRSLCATCRDCSVMACF